MLKASTPYSTFLKFDIENFGLKFFGMPSFKIVRIATEGVCHLIRSKPSLIDSSWEEIHLKIFRKQFSYFICFFRVFGNYSIWSNFYTLCDQILFFQYLLKETVDYEIEQKIQDTCISAFKFYIANYRKQ